MKSRYKNKKPLIIATIFVAAVFIAFFVNVLIKQLRDANTQKPTAVETESTEVVIEEPEPEPEPEPVVLTKVDLQPTVDEWVNANGGQKGIMIYDLDLDTVVGEYNSDASFNIASIYKLFVVYEGYNRINRGEWIANDPAGYTGYTILECLDLAIRESHSPCAETLWSKIGHPQLEEIFRTKYKNNARISNISATAKEIVSILKLYYLHPDITNKALVDRMWDSFLNQPVTTYDWRQGLPSGFSDKTKVYNKVGWAYNAAGRYWNVYDDAAIIETANGRHYIVVILTSQVNPDNIKSFGTKLEELL